jgi:hypothetical protein
MIRNETIYLIWARNAIVEMLKCDLKIYQTNLSGTEQSLRPLYDFQIKVLRIRFKQINKLEFMLHAVSVNGGNLNLSRVVTCPHPSGAKDRNELMPLVEFSKNILRPGPEPRARLFK